MKIHHRLATYLLKVELWKLIRNWETLEDEMLNSQVGGGRGVGRESPKRSSDTGRAIWGCNRRKYLHLNQRKSSHNAFSRKSSHCHVNTEEQFILWVTIILQKWYHREHCVWEHSVCTSSASHVTSVHVWVTAMRSKPSSGCKRGQENQWQWDDSLEQETTEVLSTENETPEAKHKYMLKHQRLIKKQNQDPQTATAEGSNITKRKHHKHSSGNCHIFAKCGYD